MLHTKLQVKQTTPFEEMFKKEIFLDEIMCCFFNIKTNIGHCQIKLFLGLNGLKSAIKFALHNTVLKQCDLHV